MVPLPAFADTLRTRALSLGPMRLWQSFDPCDLRTMMSVRSVFCSTLVPEAHRSILDNPALVQHFVMLDPATDMMFVVAHPLVTPEGSLVASSCDWIGRATPVRIPLTAFYGMVVSLVPAADAQTSGFPVTDAPAPDLVGGPLPAGADPDAVAPAPSFARLHFGPDPDIRPVFTLLPVAFPVPVGCEVPEAWSIQEPFPAAAQASLPAIEIWRQGLL